MAPGERPVLHAVWKDPVIEVNAVPSGRYRVAIYDVAGRLKWASAGYTDKPFTAGYRAYCTGLYIARLVTNGKAYHQRVLVLR
jgi:hypothetical protein